MNLYNVSNPTNLSVPEGNLHSEQQDQDPSGFLSVRFEIQSKLGRKIPTIVFSKALALFYCVQFPAPHTVPTSGHRAGTWEGLGREGKALGLREDLVENRRPTRPGI